MFNLAYFGNCSFALSQFGESTKFVYPPYMVHLGAFNCTIEIIGKSNLTVRISLLGINRLFVAVDTAKMQYYCIYKHSSLQ